MFSPIKKEFSPTEIPLSFEPLSFEFNKFTVDSIKSIPSFFESIISRFFNVILFDISISIASPNASITLKFSMLILLQ